MRIKIMLLLGLLALLWPRAAAADGDIIIDLQGVVHYDGSDYALVDASATGDAALTGAVHFEDGLWIEETATNLITNPSFETNTTGWSVSGVTLAKNTSYFYTGNSSASIAGTGGSNYIYNTSYIAVSSNTNYLFQVAIKKTLSSGTGQLLVRYYTGAYASLGDQYIYLDSGTHDWKNYQLSTTAPSTAAYARVLIRLNGITGSAQLYADALSFSSAPTTYLDGDHGPGYTWTSTSHASTSTRAATVIQLPVTTTLAGNTAWSARLQWTPQYAATADWPDAAVLFDARGQSNNYRVTLSYEDSDNSYHVYLNGGDRLQSSARTWAAGTPLDLWLSLDFDGYARIIEDGVEIAAYNIAPLSPPGNVYTATLGSDVYGAQHANALYTEFALLDHAVTAAETADYTGDFIIAMPPSGAVLLDEGLYSYWDMDELSGVRYDSVDGQDLTDNNTVLTTTGVINVAAIFTATNSEYLSYNLSHTPDTWTWSGWVKLSQISTTGALLNSRDLNIVYTPTTGLYLYGNTTYWYLLPGVITTTWEHVAVWDDGAGTWGARLNGINYTIPHTPPYNHNSGMYFGRYGSLYLTGALDEWGLWERLLSAEELLAIEEPTGYSEFESAVILAATPTPTITATPLPDDYYDLHFPLILNGSDGYVDFIYPTPTPESPWSAIDYSGDTSWTDWAAMIENFFAPMFVEVAAGQDSLAVLRGDVCGAGFDTTAGFLPGNAYDAPIEADLGEDPTVLDVSYSLGMALGRPFGYIRAFYSWLPAINSSYNVIGINFFVMLIYFMTAGIVWIVFVIVVTYSMYFVRTVVAAAIQIYELIPLKST